MIDFGDTVTEKNLGEMVMQLIEMNKHLQSIIHAFAANAAILDRIGDYASGIECTLEAISEDTAGMRVELQDE